jgi:hypothetical protein
VTIDFQAFCLKAPLVGPAVWKKDIKEQDLILTTGGYRVYQGGFCIGLTGDRRHIPVQDGFISQ